MAPMAVTESPAQTLLIDTDVHEMPSKGLTMQDLIPYMDPHWARFLNNNGGLWLGVPKPISYAAPVARGGVREDCDPRRGSSGERPRGHGQGPDRG